MQRITVKSVESKPTKTGNTYTKLTDDKGGVFSGFDVGLSTLAPGAVIDAEIQIDGKYANIKNYTVVSNTVPQPQQSPVSQPSAITAIPNERQYKADPVKTDSIEFQVCLKEVGECIRWNEKAVPFAARTGYWKAICERLGTADLYEKKPPDAVTDTKGTTESHLVAEVKKMQEAVVPGTPATKAQLDAINKLMMGKAPVERSDIYKTVIGREIPGSLSIEEASKVVAKLQVK